MIEACEWATRNTSQKWKDDCFQEAALAYLEGCRGEEITKRIKRFMWKQIRHVSIDAENEEGFSLAERLPQQESEEDVSVKKVVKALRLWTFYGVITEIQANRLLRYALGDYVTTIAEQDGVNHSSVSRGIRLAAKRIREVYNV